MLMLPLVTVGGNGFRSCDFGEDCPEKGAEGLDLRCSSSQEQSGKNQTPPTGAIHNDWMREATAWCWVDAMVLQYRCDHKNTQHNAVVQMNREE